MSVAVTPAHRRTPAAPGRFTRGRTLRLGRARIGYEVRSYFRQGDSVFFTFLFPVLLLAVFATAFGTETYGDGPDAVDAATYYLPAMLAAGVLVSGLQNMAIDIAVDRSDGTLKRLAGMPLSPVSYFVGKMGQVLVTGVLQTVLLIATAALLLGVDLPTDAGAWATFAWVFLLGVSTCAVLGIGIAAIPRSGRSAAAVVIPIVMVGQFVSGIYIPFTSLPDWLQDVASVFPLAWLARGMRSVFLPEGFAAVESAGSWQLGTAALVTTAWLVLGLLAARATFRWIRQDG